MSISKRCACLKRERERENDVPLSSKADAREPSDEQFGDVVNDEVNDEFEEDGQRME